jgi:hypothetical protein
MARKLRDALPGGDDTLRASVWEFICPMLSPTLTDLNRGAFVSGSSIETTVELARHRATPESTDSFFAWKWSIQHVWWVK